MNKTGVVAVLSFVFVTGGAMRIGAQDIAEQFRHLTGLKIEHSLQNYVPEGVDMENTYIYFDPDITHVENSMGMQTRDPEFYAHDSRLISTNIDRTSDKQYTIEFSEGMSLDPHFRIYAVKADTLKPLRPGITGLRLYVPGDGFLYVSGHTNNTYDQHRMFRIENESIVEVVQPFYYVGLQSVANRELELWNDSMIIGTIPEGTPLTVLLNRKEGASQYSYLVKTEFGLVGWVRFKSEELYMWTDPNPIEGLYYLGD